MGLVGYMKAIVLVLLKLDILGLLTFSSLACKLG